MDDQDQSKISHLPGAHHSNTRTGRDTEKARTLDFPESGWTRTPKIFDQLDWLTEVLIYLSIIFAPWAFGTTQPWSIQTLNWLGFSIGFLLVAKWIVRLICKYQPHRWGFTDQSAPNHKQKISQILTLALVFLNFLLLVYVLTSAMNARAEFVLSLDYFKYNDNYNPNLPHSYDASKTWQSFWQILSLTCIFWGLRDWMLGKTKMERHAFMQSSESDSSENKERNNRYLIPTRLKKLLWVISINSALLALVSIVQRLDGGNKLLWLIEPSRNRTTESQFGPYAYRSNATQYLNLAWPICLAFWWGLSRNYQQSFRKIKRIGGGSHVVLLPLSILIASSPLIATSRGGVVVALLAATLSFITLTFSTTGKSALSRIGILTIFAAVLSLGFWLGWEPLEKRLFSVKTKYSTLSKEVYSDEVSIFTRIRLPNAEYNKLIYLPSITPIQSSFTSPFTLVSRITHSGSLEIYQTGNMVNFKNRLTIEGFRQKFAHQNVEILIRKTDSLSVYVNGEEMKGIESISENLDDWSLKVGVNYLWCANGLKSESGEWEIEKISIYNQSLSPSDLTQLADLPELKSEYGLIFEEKSLSSSFLSSINSSKSGREEIYGIASRMIEDFPVFGFGPGTFANVSILYHENSYQNWHAYVHDDYLECIITFGKFGSSIVLLLFIIVILNWFIGAGIYHPITFGSLLLIAIGGFLFHAKLDFPFQVYSLTHFFTVIMCVLFCNVRH